MCIYFILCNCNSKNIKQQAFYFIKYNEICYLTNNVK